MISTKYSIDEVFQACVSIIHALPKTGPIDPGYEKQLVYYSLYKQALHGVCDKPKPRVWDIVERAKWEAWKGVEHLTPEQAKVEYITKLRQEFWDLYKTEDRNLVADLSFLKNMSKKTLQIFFWDLFDEAPPKYLSEIEQIRDIYFPGSSLLKEDYM